ncbi:MAG: helix-turn-helix domain-containing protein, partial [Cetobacterium sp.]
MQNLNIVSDRQYQYIGQRIRQKREDLGLTISALSQQLHMSRSSLNRVELGYRDLSWTEVQTLSSMLQIPYSQLEMKKSIEKRSDRFP